MCIKIVELPYEQRYYLVVHDRGSIWQIVDCDKLIWKQVTFSYCIKGNLLLESSVLFD